MYSNELTVIIKNDLRMTIIIILIYTIVKRVNKSSTSTHIILVMFGYDSNKGTSITQTFDESFNVE